MLNSNKKQKKQTIKFYKTDQPKSGWKDIGVEGEIIEELTSGEVVGTIVEYSYIPGNGEFLLKLDSLNDEYNGRYTLIYRDGNTARITKEDLSGSWESRKHIEIEWNQTKRGYHTKKKMARYKELGLDVKSDGYLYEKKINPRNCIKAIFNVIKQLNQMKKPLEVII